MPWSRFDSTYEAVDGTRTTTFVEAIREGIDQAMCLDPKVFAIGLDCNDKFGVFGSMSNLTHPERVLGTPISENAMMGVALGAALSGMRPINVHLRNDFLLAAMDQIVNYVAKWEQMFDYQVKVPLVIRSIIGRGWGCGAQHSQTNHAIFSHVPGLKVIMPSTPYDVKGLLLSALKDDSPVMFFEHRWLYKNTGNVPEEMYTIPIGKGKRLHKGSGITVVASSLASMHALTACETHGLDVDLIDLRTIKPLDEEIILESVARTGRLLVIDYDFPFAGVAAEICAMVAEKAFDCLRAAPERLTFPDLGMPASGVLERAYYPRPDEIALRISAVLDGASANTQVCV